VWENGHNYPRVLYLDDDDDDDELILYEEQHSFRSYTQI
jgi:hypothetical protein